MSSCAPIAFVAAATAFVAVAWTGPSESAAQAAPTAAHGSAEVIECARGKRPRHRRAVFRGEMTLIDGATRMVMRIHLHEKIGSEPWRGIHAPGVDVPREARPGVTRFAYRQRVLNLSRGASYRVGITFRWYSADGKEIKHEMASSPACRQPGRLPNPKLRDSVKVADGPTPETRRYVVRVGNTGRVPARNIFLRLFVDGAEVDTRRIGRLAPRQRRAIRFVGPVCRGFVVAQLDPEDRIPEIAERDNVVRNTCAELEPL